MNAVKIIKDIEDTILDELKAFYGQKVEIIILPLDDGNRLVQKEKLFDIIDRNQGIVEKYTRDELYDR